MAVIFEEKLKLVWTVILQTVRKTKNEDTVEPLITDTLINEHLQ
jgi:hypothetical protein